MNVSTERVSGKSGTALLEDQKQRQIEYHERAHYDARRPRTADNRHPLVAWLNSYRLRTALALMGEPLEGRSVLSVCGGDGEEADFLERQGAQTTMIDLSEAGVRAARVRNPAVRSLRIDGEALAFPDRSFDWVLVRDGLHHLARPLKGLYEMERVARLGFVLLEGQDSAIVRLLVRLGLGENWDPAGDYVYRFSRREISKVLRAVQTVERWRISTAWLPPGSDLLAYFPAVRRLVYPAIDNRIVRALLTSRTGRRCLGTIFRLVQALAGRWGNSLIVVAWKKSVTEAHGVTGPCTMRRPGGEPGEAEVP